MARHITPLGAQRRRTALLLALLATLPAAALAGSPAPGLFQPATAVFITYDNSASMDFTTEFGVVPAFPVTCDNAVEYARTRHVMGIEALTGSLQNYCPIEEQRSETPGSRDDDDVLIPHTRPQFDWQRRDGVLDVYSDQLFFGLGTFDAQPGAGNDEAGDYSWGLTYPGYTVPINLGLASEEAPIGGLISPLPPGWLPSRPGAVRAFRLANNSRIQNTLLNVIPGGGTPIAAAIDDVQQLFHLGPGIRSDPFADCRSYVHVLVTDGDPMWDICYTNASAAEPWMACEDYVLSYDHSLGETGNLTLGTGCEGCPVDTTMRAVPTYVVAFAVDDPAVADDLAEYGGTCALLDELGNCLEYSFETDYTGELAFALGTVFNQFVDGRLSMVPPITSTVAFDEDLGIVRFRASATVSRTSPYWTGELTRQLFTCVAPQTAEPKVLTPTDVLLIHETYTPEVIDVRNIWTARLDVAAEGASCDRPTCTIGNDNCDRGGAVPDPLSDGTLTRFGDGTGGMDSGGSNDDAAVRPPEPSANCVDVNAEVAAEYQTCAAACNNEADCLCDCEEFFGCGTCGYVATAPACPALGAAACQLLCPALGITADACLCQCEGLLSCGTCWNGVPALTVSDAPSRAEINEALRAERSLAATAGNDTPLPEVPATVNFDLLEVNDNSCLIPFDTGTFVLDQNLTAFLYAENNIEAERTIEFTRGATLTSLRDRGLLAGLFDPTLVELHDRVAIGYVGDFLHTRMALLGRPNLFDRTSNGFIDFVELRGNRPYTLFAGANDGMLHAWDAITGVELWAIIPPSFLPELGKMVFSHRLSVDGAIDARDLRCSQSIVAGEVVEEWCSLLAVSYRSGGSGAMVLDVSDPTAPRFLFEVTGRQIPELGHGYPTPLLGNMFIDDGSTSGVRPVLVLAGGRPLDGPEMMIGDRILGSHEGETLVVLDALTGEIYRQFDPVSDPDLFAQCGPVTGSPSGWSPDLFTRIFVGTANGCLLRVDTSNVSPATWTIESLYQVASQGEITFAPAIAPRPDGSLVAVFGTGNPDEFEHVNQRGSFVSVNENRLLVEGVGGTLDTFVLAGVTANWEILLEPGEMLTTAPLIADGVVFAGSWLPAANACDGGGSRVYTIDYVGDPTVSGPDSTRPELVSVASDRIVGRFPNPLHDPADVTSEPFLKFLDETNLGGNTVVFGISIEPLPSCKEIDPITGVAQELLATTVTRQLLIDVVGNLAAAEAAEAQPTTGVGQALPTEIGIISIEHNIPNPRMSAVPLDWGVVLEF